MEGKEQSIFNPTYTDQNIEKILHFGAIISISPTGEEYKDSYMSSDGFILKNIVLKIFKMEFDDFSESLFKVVPPYLYDIQKEMINVVQNENDEESNLFLRTIHMIRNYIFLEEITKKSFIFFIILVFINENDFSKIFYRLISIFILFSSYIIFKLLRKRKFKTLLMIWIMSSNKTVKNIIN